MHPPKVHQLDEWVILPENLDPYGVVGYGGSLDVERMVRAYSNGIFPWPQDGEVYWFCPPKRGVLKFDQLKVNSRFLRDYRNCNLEFRQNLNFEAVVRGCAGQPRKGQRGTWITEEIVAAYYRLYKVGRARSFEAYRGKKLIGGLYGVSLPGFFAGESVFAHEDNVSKFCLYRAIRELQVEGLEWMDIQMVTPLTEKFGGTYVDRSDYLKMLKQALSK